MATPTILWRYVLREVALYTLLALAASALLMVAGNLLKDSTLLGIVAGELTLLVRLLASILPAYLSYIIPAALFCGVLLALSRMSSDGEIVALRASGLGPGALLIPVACLGALSAVLIAFVSFELEPQSHLEMRMLRRELLAAHSLIETGKVRPLGSGRTLFIAAQGDEACPLRGVVIADLHRADQPSYVTAACGRIVESQGEGDLALDLSGGAIHVGQWGTDRYDRIRFGGSVVDLRLNELDFFDKRLSQYSLAELLRGPNRDYSAEAIHTEIQRRLAFLFSGLLLGLLAVPLGVQPGRGRSSGLLLSAGGLIGYWCAFTAAQAAAQSGLVPAWCLWLPDAGVALLAWALLRRNPGGEL